MNDTEIREFRGLIREFERKINDQQRYTRCCNVVTLAQCHILMDLETAGPLTVIGLAEKQGLDKSTVSRTVDNLVRKKYITRKEDPVDRRYVQIELTKQGRTICDMINQENDQYYKSVFSTIDKIKHRDVLEGIRLFIDAVNQTDQKE